MSSLPHEYTLAQGSYDSQEEAREEEEEGILRGLLLGCRLCCCRQQRLGPILVLLASGVRQQVLVARAAHAAQVAPETMRGVVCPRVAAALNDNAHLLEALFRHEKAAAARRLEHSLDLAKDGVLGDEQDCQLALRLPHGLRSHGEHGVGRVLRHHGPLHDHAVRGARVRVVFGGVRRASWLALHTGGEGGRPKGEGEKRVSHGWGKWRVRCP